MRQKAVVGILIGVAVGAAHAADDPAQCKRMVDAFLQGEAMISPNALISDQPRRKTDAIQQMRADRVPECDIQRRLVGTAAQLPDKRPSR